MARLILAMGLCMLLTANAQAAERRSHGDIVSDCNHVANAQNLKGRARKDFVEWCNARALRGDDVQVVRYSQCYERASALNLGGDERREFIGLCVDRTLGIL